MRWTILGAACVLAGAGIASAAGIAPAEVKFDDYGAIDVSLSGKPGDPAAGRKIMANRALGNCVACHQVTDLADVPFQGEVGPTLDGVADRWNQAELRGIVSDAKKTYEGTIMPSFYKTTGYIRPGIGFTTKPAEEPLPPMLTGQQIEDVVAYLMTLKEN